MNWSQASVSNNTYITNSINVIFSELVLDEAACLKKEKEALEEKIFDLELEQKRQLYQTEGILRFHLNNSTGERLSRKLLICPSDGMSSTSSGFVSGCSNIWGQKSHPLVTSKLSFPFEYSDHSFMQLQN